MQFSPLEPLGPLEAAASGSGFFAFLLFLFLEPLPLVASSAVSSAASSATAAASAGPRHSQSSTSIWETPPPMFFRAPGLIREKKHHLIQNMFEMLMAHGAE